MIATMLLILHKLLSNSSHDLEDEMKWRCLGNSQQIEHILRKHLETPICRI